MGMAGIGDLAGSHLGLNGVPVRTDLRRRHLHITVALHPDRRTRCAHRHALVRFWDSNFGAAVACRHSRSRCCHSLFGIGAGCGGANIGNDRTVS